VTISYRLSRLKVTDASDDKKPDLKDWSRDRYGIKIGVKESRTGGGDRGWGEEKIGQIAGGIFVIDERTLEKKED